MVAGIENLGEGLLKGYQFGLQQQRQKAQDVRQAMLDKQNQEQHNLSMQSNQFNLEQAKKKATLDEKARNRLDLGNKNASSAILLYKSGKPLDAFSSIADGYNSDPDAPYNIQVLGGRGDNDKDTGEPIFMGKVRYTDKVTGKIVQEGELDFRHATSLYRDYFTGQNKFAETEDEQRKDTRKRALDKAEKILEEGRAQKNAIERIEIEKKFRPPEKPDRAVVYDANGNMGVVDKITGLFKPITDSKGKPIKGKGKSELPATALKMQQEHQDAIGSAAGINTTIDKILNQIETGRLSLSPIDRAVAYARNNTNNSNEQSRNIASFQATLEKLRNDSLRLNAGVQTDGDAKRAWNQLVTNINDKELVRQRLKEISEINEQAIKLHKLEIEQIRQNFNAPQLDNFADNVDGSLPQVNIYDFNQLPD